MKPETREWLDFAVEDLRMCRLARDAGLFGPACFHAQQCGEKSLKALVAERAAVPKIHRLAELVTLATGLGFGLAPFEPAALRLDRYYIVTRYPLLSGPLAPGRPTATHADEALADAEGVHAVCTGILGV